MARIPMQVVGPFRDAAIGDTVRVSLKDSRNPSLAAVGAKPAKTTAKKAAKKAPAKKAAKRTYNTRALKAK